MQSLCSLKLKPSLSMSTCLYVLQLTFHIVEDVQFCTELYTSLFVDKIPKKTLARVEKQWQSLNPANTKQGVDS